MITPRAVAVLLACGAAVPQATGGGGFGAFGTPAANTGASFGAFNSILSGQSCFGVPAPQKLPLGARRHLGAPLVLPRRPTAARLGRRLAFHDAFDQQSDDLRTLCGLAPEDRWTKRAARSRQRPCTPPRSRSLTVLAPRSVQVRRV